MYYAPMRAQTSINVAIQQETKSEPVVTPARITFFKRVMEVLHGRRKAQRSDWHDTQL